MKPFLATIFLLAFSGLAFSQTAKEISEKALDCDSAGESIVYLKKTIPNVASAAEKRALYSFLASLQEQISAYKDASDSYAKAAGISVPAGEKVDGLLQKTSADLVLDAVRCALCSGDSAVAESYLNSAVRASGDKRIQAYIKLYEVWSALCKIQSAAELEESVSLLKTYADFPSMDVVKPSVLLTLWYVTGQKSYGDSLKEKFPKSAEAAIVGGSVQMMPAPFWYFMPKKGMALQDAAEQAAESQAIPAQEVSGAEENSASEEKTEKIKRQQLGLFRNRANADSLCDRLTAKGFKPYVTEETRASGTTYYIVVVDENAAGTIGDQLRSAGFECYPVF